MSMRKQTIVIRADKEEDGYYRLVESNGDYAQEAYAHKSRQSAYADAALLWPYNSTWQGHKVKGGYRITID